METSRNDRQLTQKKNTTIFSFILQHTSSKTKASLKKAARDLFVESQKGTHPKNF